MVIRGEKEDNAVLCTNTQTYDIKEGEVSNAMLLLTDLDHGNGIEDTGDPQVEYREVYIYYNLNKLRT